MPERTQTLARMTEALEAAKRARDRGVNVKDAREDLKRARNAFEAGDYRTARTLADRIIDRLEPTGGAVPAPPAGLPWTDPSSPPGRSAALDRMNQALEIAQQAQAQGVNVRPAKKHLKRMKAAYDRGDYQSAMAEADRVVQACGFLR